MATEIITADVFEGLARLPDSSGIYRPAVSHERLWMLGKSVTARGWWMRKAARDEFSTEQVTGQPDLFKGAVE